MPICSKPEELCGNVDEDTIRLCLPLSPTKNVWNRMHPMKQLSYGKRIKEYAWILARVLRIEKFWAEKIRVSVVRCSEATKKADTANIISGIEKHLDALVFAGFVEDDDPDHLELGSIDERTKGTWIELQGPGTWFILERIG